MNVYQIIEYFNSAIIVALIIYLLFLIIKIDKNLDCIKTITVNNKTYLQSKVLQLNSFVNRRAGLLNHISLNINEGMLIRSNHKISTYGMKFNIDIIFISKQGIVVKIIKNALPENTFHSNKKYSQVLELSTNNPFNISEGDHLIFKN